MLRYKIPGFFLLLILGAGAAGLAAASRLTRSGFLNVTILEASNRVGGRIRSSLEFGKNHSFVELGAQWIHGEVANVAFKLANQAGLVDSSESEKNEKFVFTNVIEEDVAHELEDIFDHVWESISNMEDQSESVGFYADMKFNEEEQR